MIYEVRDCVTGEYVIVEVGDEMKIIDLTPDGMIVEADFFEGPQLISRRHYPKLNLNPTSASHDDEEYTISQSCRKPRKKKPLTTEKFVRRSGRKRNVVKYADSSDEEEEEVREGASRSPTAKEVGAQQAVAFRVVPPESGNEICSSSCQRKVRSRGVRRAQRNLHTAPWKYLKAYL